MNVQKTRPANGHPIQIAARRSGLTPDVIRAWERRYHAVEPFRSETNRRLYTEEDIEKLFLLSQVTRAGRRIGDVAGLSLERLRKLVEEDDEAAVRVGKLPVTEVRERSGEPYVDTAMEFLKQLDWAGMESLLTEASVTLSTPVLMEQMLTPLLHRVGDGWQCGSLRIAHEHMAAAMVRSLLGNLRNSGTVPGTAPELVVATPAGQRHELGAMMVAVAAASDGWQVTYLGADLPAAEIAAAALLRDARVVALSIVHPADDPKLPGELNILGSSLGKETVLLAGGTGAEAYSASLSAAGARIIRDIPKLRTELQALRSS